MSAEYYEHRYMFYKKLHPVKVDTFAWYNVKFALFSASSLKDKKLIKKQTYTKTETCKLYSRVFWIFLPNAIKIDPYNFERYRFKVCAFFLSFCFVFFLIDTVLNYVWCDVMTEGTLDATPAASVSKGGCISIRYGVRTSDSETVTEHNAVMTASDMMRHWRYWLECYRTIAHVWHQMWLGTVQCILPNHQFCPKFCAFEQI